MIRKFAMLIAVLGIVSLVLGAVFVGQAAQKNAWITSSMQQEKVTLGLTEEQIASGEIIDTAGEAQKAADTIREHRHGIAPTYSELGRYDPTNPQHLTYTQALNLENYLYMAVLSFGVIQEITGTGIAFIVIGIALAGTGLVLYRLDRASRA